LRGSSGRIIPDEVRSSIQALDQYINETSVEFYSKLEEILECGPKGYLLGFAYKQGMELLNERDNYEDKTWQDKVRVCL